jgi:hypothetical protein
LKSPTANPFISVPEDVIGRRKPSDAPASTEWVTADELLGA